MPALPTSPRVKLRSASRRVPRAPGAAQASEADTEPTMPLSRAILVIFLLHVVAIGGYLGSCLINDRHRSSEPGAPLEAEDSPIAAKPASGTPGRRSPEANDPTPAPASPGARQAETPIRVANGGGAPLAMNRTPPEVRPPGRAETPAGSPPSATSSALDLIEGRHASKPSSSSAGTKPDKPSADSGKLYVVGKGENAYNIAQKLHLNYGALLKLNQIEDPKQLKPGQKLRLPPASKPK